MPVGLLSVSEGGAVDVLGEIAGRLRRYRSASYFFSLVRRVL